jgi:hypothetical protein
MSFPSVYVVLEERGLQLNEASEGDLESALWEAFGRDLPLGRTYLESLAEEAIELDDQVQREEDPTTLLAGQLMRLLGTDVARRVCEENLGVNFTFLNCCAPAASPKEKKVRVTARDQVILQKPERANC